MSQAVISAGTVKRLRESTGAGMMDCKNALKESGGDFDQAVQILRKAGQAQAEKRAGRVAAEGLVSVAHSDDGKTYVMTETNCETDFVARDEQFTGFAAAAARAALEGGASDVAGLAGLSLADGRGFEDARETLVSKIGENVRVRRLDRVEISGDRGVHYVHGGRIGVVVDVAGGDEGVAKDVALHIAASSPMCVGPDEVPAEALAREEDIYRAQAEESGKPAPIIDKIIQGKMRKYLESVTLLGQPFVKDTDMTVGEFLKKNGATVKAFRRYEVGEGIEKADDNFVEEVMQAAGGSSETGG